MNLYLLQSYKQFLFLFLFLVTILSASDRAYLTQNEKEWIKEHPNVILGADFNWPPYDFVLDDKYTGIASDYIQLISRKSGLNFNVKPDIWSNVMKKMKSKQLDGLTCAVKTEEREQFLNFTKPYLSMPLAIIVKKDRLDIETILDLKDKVVSINRGSYLHEWLVINHPNIKLLLTNSNEESVEAVSFGKADAYIGNIAVATYIIKNRYLTNLNIVNKLQDLSTKVSIAIDKNKPILFSIVKKSLAQISEKEHKKINEKWFGNFKIEEVDNNKIVFNSLEKEFISKHPVIRVGGGPDWAPIDFVDGEEYSGIANDYLNLISTKTGLEFKIIVDKWANNLKKIKNKEIDMLDAVYYRDERVEYMNFTESYFELLDYFFIRSNLKVRDISDLDGKVVAMPKGYAHGEILKKDFPNIKILSVSNFNEAIDSVAKGRADILFDTYASISFVLQKEGIKNIVPFQAYRGKEVNKIHMTTRLDYVTLVSILDKALLSITPKEHKKIREKWFTSAPDYTLFYQIAFGLFLLLVGTFYWNRKLSLEISKRKIIEIELRESQKLLEEQTQKAISANKAKSEFLSNMSHEIRTPMNAIIGFTELLDEQLKEERLKAYVKTIQNASNTLLILINDILDLSKIEAGKLEIKKVPVDLNALCNEVSTVFTMSIKNKGLDFLLDIDKDIPKSLLIDEVRLRQVLFNLIGNAVKFTEKGSVKLIVRVSSVYEHNSKLDIKIMVQDDGIGIPKNQLTRIFKKFEQQDGQDNRKFGGTGLGLSISKKLCKMMDGTIYAQSEEGKGATFVVELFNIDISSVVVSKELDKQLSFNIHSIIFDRAKILIVDDIKDNRDLIIKNFEDTNIDVVSAEDGLDAIEKFKKEQPDLILMDIRMPKMDGYESARRIKEIVDVPIVALTASVMKDDYEKLKRDSFNGYLRKPVLRYDLFSELSKFLKHQTLEHTETKTVITSLSEKAKLNIDVIVDEFQKTITPIYKDVSQTNNITNIKTLASKISSLANEYDIELLDKFGSELYNAVDSFDILKMKKLLDDFDKLEEEILSFKN